MDGLRTKRSATSVVKTTFSWPFPEAKEVYVVGNFDRFLRHSLKRQANGEFSTVLSLPIGEYLYKYIVDGEYCVRPDADSASILVDREGTPYIRLVVSKSRSHRNSSSGGGSSGEMSSHRTLAVEVEDASRGGAEGGLHPLGDGAVAAAGAGAKNGPMGATTNARRSTKKERKSILRRASDIFNKNGRTSVGATTGGGGGGGGGATTAPSLTNFTSLSGSHAAATYGPTSQRASTAGVLSSSKENQSAPVNANPRQSWRRSLKPSRSSLVSAPVTVDTLDPKEVETKVKQWREYAKTLQHWGDTDGANVLYNQALNLLEEKDCLRTQMCAQVHVDLAHALSRQEDFVSSERHVKLALEIYSSSGYDRPERHGDLLSYLAVMVDRQKRRQDAEVYYQEALRVYRLHNVKGDNVAITTKNLRINLKKQGKDAEAELNKTFDAHASFKANPVERF